MALASALVKRPYAAAWLAALLCTSACAVQPASFASPGLPRPVAAQPQSIVVALKASDNRNLDLYIWPASTERGVIVFSHGFGGQPRAYDRLFTFWANNGFSVIAPLHLDSLQHPQRSEDGPTAFATRLVDLEAARRYAAADDDKLPLIVAGHSFGSLMALTQAGAVTPAGDVRDPNVKGVMAFSSPGGLAGLITAESYASVEPPLLMVTGDHDLVPGYADDWRDHRLAFDAGPGGDKTLMVFRGGDHQLITSDEAFEPLSSMTLHFLAAYGLDDPIKRMRLMSFSTPDATIEHR